MRRFLQWAILLCFLVSSSLTLAAGQYVGERNSFGRFHGEGIYTTSRGDVYNGIWVDGRKSGKGTYVWKNGDKYSGEWKNNKRNGYGEMDYANGNVYKGDWAANTARGEGVMEYKNKDIYRGLFKDGAPNGQGKMKYANGDRYTGNWTNGLPTGKGTYHLKNGDKVVAVWKAGDIVSGTSKYRFASGEEFKGPLRKLIPNGKGECIVNGQSKSCEYKLGKIVVAKTPVKPKKVVVLPKTVKKEVRPPKPAVKPVAVKPPKPKVYVSNKQEFYLEHDWEKNGRFGNLEELVCEIIEDDLDDTKELRIIAKSSDMSVSMKVNDYRGVGEYPISFYGARAKFKNTGGYATTDESPGKLVVTRDNGKLLSATFSFVSYPNGNVSLGNKRGVKKGYVTVKPDFE